MKEEGLGEVGRKKNRPKRKKPIRRGRTAAGRTETIKGKNMT